MSSHVPHPNEDVLRELPSQIGRPTQRLLLLVGVGTTVITIAGEWSEGEHLLNKWLLQHAGTFGALLNLVLISLILFASRIQPLDADIRDRRVRRAAQCINAFCLPALTWFWRCFGLIYVLHLFRQMEGAYVHEHIHLSVPTGQPYSLYTVLVELLSAGVNFFILVAYASLTPGFLRAYFEEGEGSDSWADVRRRNRWRTSAVVWKCAAWVLPFAIGSVLVQLWLLDRGDPLTWSRVATTANGVASAIALGFFVGRMDSKFVLNWQWAIPLLFTYAAIQAYSTVLYEPSPFQIAVLIYTGFTLKCVLFIFLSNVFESRRVLYYAIEVHQSEQRAT